MHTIISIEWRIGISECSAKFNFFRRRSICFCAIVCGKGFKWASSLSKHMKHHTRRKILNCPYCPKYYVEARSLNIHLRSHTGEKPFVCSTCKKGFTQMGNLEKHLRVSAYFRSIFLLETPKLAYDLLLCLGSHRRKAIFMSSVSKGILTKRICCHTSKVCCHTRIAPQSTENITN